MLVVSSVQMARESLIPVYHQHAATYLETYRITHASRNHNLHRTLSLWSQSHGHPVPAKVHAQHQPVFHTANSNTILRSLVHVGSYADSSKLNTSGANMAVQTTSLVAVETGFDITATRCLTAYGQGCVGRLNAAKLVLLVLWLHSLTSLNNKLAQTVAPAQFLTS
jgi:hypothetical protein